ncbi:hypothetical protein QJQ45_025337 [Haematococcus lacustris]|nr:hypothetical protein QJQ45_025337 [Haematococcus lacustris]
MQAAIGEFRRLHRYLTAFLRNKTIKIGGAEAELEAFFLVRHKASNERIEGRDGKRSGASSLRTAWSQLRDQPVRGMVWCPVVAPREPAQPPCSSQEASQPAASEPGPSTPPSAKRSKRIKAEQAAEPTQPTKGTGKAQRKAAKAKAAPQPGSDMHCGGRDSDCPAKLRTSLAAYATTLPQRLACAIDRTSAAARAKILAYGAVDEAELRRLRKLQELSRRETEFSQVKARLQSLTAAHPQLDLCPHLLSGLVAEVDGSCTQANIMLDTPFGPAGLPQAKIVDFGLCQIKPCAEAEAVQMWRCDVVVGPDVLYIDPVMHQHRLYSRGTDIFGVAGAGTAAAAGAAAAAGVDKREQEQEREHSQSGCSVGQLAICCRGALNKQMLKEALRQFSGGLGQMTEAAIMDSLEKMCDPDREAGEWITHQDLQEEGKQLKLVDMGQQVLETLDLSEMSEMLWKGTKRAALTQAACYDSGRACRKKAPPLPAERAPGPAFKALDEEKAGHAKLMRSMKEAGLKGTMYNKDSMMDMMAGASDDGEEEQELRKPIMRGCQLCVAELCSWKDREALPPVGKEYQQGYKRVNDRLPKVRQRLHRAAEYRRGIDGRARNNA